MSTKDKLFFTKNLSILIKSGVPIVESLNLIKEQFVNKKNQEIINKIIKEITNGQSISSALKKQKNIFDNFFINIIKIGEESGTLEENLKFLAIQIEKDNNLKQKIQGALIYPSLIMAITFIMGGFISFFILPQLVDFFSNFEIELPLTTKILLSFANLIKNYGFVIFLLMIFTTSLILFIYKKIKIFRKFIQNLFLDMPIIKNLIKYNILSKTTRNLGILLKSGIPITSSLEIIEKTIDYLPYKEAINTCYEELKKGEQLKTGMEKNLNLFPKTLISIINTGEKSGNLDEVLLYMGNFYEEEIDYITKSLTTILEPLILFLIGTIVGFFALSIIQPIYQLTGGLK